MKKLVLSILAIYIMTFCANASLKELVTEYLSNNADVIRENSKVQQREYALALKQVSKNWLLSASSSYLDSNLENSTSFTNYPYRNKTYDVGLSRDFFWGGEFGLSNTLVDGRINKGESRYGFSQGLSYSQDLGANLFGRNDKLELGILRQEQGLQVKRANAYKEEQVLVLINYYLNCLENIRIEKLQKVSLARAIKIEKMISSRVKDGLKLKADLYNSTSTKLLKKEEIESLRLRILVGMNEISKLLHREVKREEISGNEGFLKHKDVMKKFIDNKHIQVLDGDILVERLKLDLIGNALLPEMKIKMKYTTNQYDPTASKSFESGNILGSNQEFSVGVNLSWQIGSESAKVERSSAFLRMETKKYQKKKLLENLKIAFNSLNQQLKARSHIIDFGVKRTYYAKKTLKEYNRLYKNGRVNIDQIIRAEENLIETEKGVARARIENERILFSMVILNGELLDMLTGNMIK